MERVSGKLIVMYFIHPATHGIRGHNFQEEFLFRPLLNRPYPESSLSRFRRPSVKYYGISETTRNHARYEEPHSAAYQFRFLRFPELSYTKYTTKRSNRQAGNLLPVHCSLDYK